MPKRRYSGSASALKRRRYRTYKRPKVVRKRGLVRRLGQEINFVDTAAASREMSTTGAISLLATIAQGAAQTQRIGRKIVLKSIQVRGSVYTGTTTVTSKVSWIIVYDKRPTGVLPAITDILVTANSNSMTNSENVGRFQIVARKDYAMVGNTGTAGQQDSKTMYNVEKFIKIRKPMVFKSAGNGAIGDIEQGALYIVTVGDQATGTSDCSAYLGFRTRFLDV